MADIPQQPGQPQGSQQPPQGPAPTGEFKPNIYPVMFWGLTYGAIAGVVLFIVYLLSSYLTVVWFPVFLAGLIWGGYRNYQKQRTEWYENRGVAPQSKGAMAEFRDAVSDVAQASREMVAEQRTEDEALLEQEQALAEEEQLAAQQQPQQGAQAQQPEVPQQPNAPGQQSASGGAQPPRPPQNPQSGGSGR